MCGFPTSYPVGKRLLDAAELAAIVDDARDLGTLVISLGGGEPFLRGEVDALIEHIDRVGITPFVHTNGSLLCNGRCARLARCSRLVVAFSLDSHRRSTHDRLRNLACYDAAIASARYFVAHAPRVRVMFTFTITAANHRDMLATTRLAHDLGVRAIRFTPIHDNLQHRCKPAAELAPLQLGPELLAELGDEIDRVIDFAHAHGMITNSEDFLRAIPASTKGRIAHDCYAGFFFCSVDPWGDILPCYDHSAAINIRDFDGLTAAFASPAMDALRQRVGSCPTRCWNVGTAEPSLRLDQRFFLRQLPHLVRESLFFMA